MVGKRNYRQEYDRYQGKPNQIKRRSSRNKARAIMAKKGLYYNINQRKKKGISRPKSKSTITPKAYANMKAGFPKKKKRG